MRTHKIHANNGEGKPLCNGVTFLGYRIFYNYRLLRRRNIRYFKKKLKENKSLLIEGKLTEEEFQSRINGWLGYANFSNSYNLLRKLEIIT